MTDSSAGRGEPPARRFTDPEFAEADNRLNLLYEVGRQVASTTQIAQLIEHITRMTQQALQATASSVLLHDSSGQDLLFEVAEGQAQKQLHQAKLNAGSGIAGWVARHGKPVLVNDVSRDERFNGNIDKNTGFVTRSIICAPLIVHRQTIGVIEVLNKQDGSDFTGEDLETLVSVASTAAMSIENVRLHQDLLRSYKSTIRSLAAAIDAKDNYTLGHSQRVMEYALLGGTTLFPNREELEPLEYAGLLHDIGKIGIADSILTKPGALSGEEWATMRRHPQIGAHILEEIPFLQDVRDLILHHHERYDGRGYPDGLNGEEIPLESRLLAVADAYDTMTTDRAYRPAIGQDQALDELRRCCGTQFCPIAVEAFTGALARQAADQA